MEKRTEVDYIIEKDGISKLVHVDLLRKFGQRTMTNVFDQREDIEMHIMCNVIESNAMTRGDTQRAEFISEIPDGYKERLRVMEEEEYKDVITTELGHTDRVEHRIELTAELPSRIKRYQIPQSYKEEVEKQVKELLTGKVWKSDSQFASPLVIVRKKRWVSKTML